jgi:hypothetical protein
MVGVTGLSPTGDTSWTADCGAEQLLVGAQDFWWTSGLALDILTGFLFPQPADEQREAIAATAA